MSEIVISMTGSNNEQLTSSTPPQEGEISVSSETTPSSSTLHSEPSGKINTEQQHDVDEFIKVLRQNCEKIIEAFKSGQTSDVIFWTFLTTQIVKQAEQSKLKGMDKKVIALHLGQMILKETISDPIKLEQDLILYNAFAETFIDTLVSAAKDINSPVVKQETVNIAPKSCCSIM